MLQEGSLNIFIRLYEILQEAVKVDKLHQVYTVCLHSKKRKVKRKQNTSQSLLTLVYLVCRSRQ